jgi:hypothetical protein
MRGGQVLDGYNDAIRVESTLVASLVGVEIGATLQGGPSGPVGPWAVEVMEADSARADSLWIHDTEPGAIAFRQVDAVSAYGNLLERNRLASAYGQQSVVLIEKPRRGRVAQSVIEADSVIPSGLAGVHVLFDTFSPGANVTVDSITVRGTYYGVTNQASGCCCCEDSRAWEAPRRSTQLTSGDTLLVRGSLIDNSSINSTAYAVYANSVQHLIVRNNTLDSAYSYAVYAYNFGDAVVENNLIRGGFNYGDLVRLDYGTTAWVSGNSFEQCSTAQAMYLYYVANDTVTGNSMSLCSNGMFLNGNGQAEVSDNVMTVTGPAHGMVIYGDWNRVHVARNDISGTFGYQAGIRIDGSIGLDTAIVDSNTVHDGMGDGIRIEATVLQALMRGNTVERMSPYFGFGYALKLQNTGRARLVNNRLAQNKTRGMYLAVASDTTFLDSTVVVDDSLAAVTVTSAATVVGSRNFIARNDSGMTGTGLVTISNSVFQGNRAFGASGTASWSLAGNWWGDANGPRVLPPGDSLPTAGDSAFGVAYVPWLTAAPDTPTGAPSVRPLLAQSQRAAAAEPARGAVRFVRPRPWNAPVRRAAW